MKLGVIGAGNMGGAIVRGVVASGLIEGAEIAVADVLADKADALARETGAVVAQSNAQAVQQADWVLLAVKPIFAAGLLAEIAPYLAGKCLLSIVTGWTHARLEAALASSGARILRVMPNTPAMVGEGLTILCEHHTLSQDEFAYAKAMFEKLGKVSVLPERLFTAAIATAGSSPAYAYLFIEAMADGAVRLGLPRAAAYDMAAQAVLGAARMVLETGTHPAALKDAVCSPGGTTIEAVYALEKGGLRAAVMDAMKACADRADEMDRAQ